MNMEVKMSQPTRPTISNGKTGVGSFGVAVMPDGTTDSLRTVIKPDGFHFEAYDFDDLTLPSLKLQSPIGSKYTISFDDNGNLLVNGKVYTTPPVTAFQGTITSTSTDFNSLTIDGHYDIRFSPNTQGNNGPKDINWGLLDVKSAGRMVVQTYYGDVNSNVYVRNCRDGTTWSAWREITS